MKFPIRLSDSVYAKEDGMEVHGNTVPWRTVAKQVKYRQGEPWVFSIGDGPMICVAPETDPGAVSGQALHRSACMICNSEKEFAVLRELVLPYFE